MGIGETGIGESPAIPGSFHGMPPGGLTLKKKVWPKTSPKKLTVKKNWKTSFNKFNSRKGVGARGS